MKIKYVISTDGQITLDFEGFRGKLCLAEFEKVLRALKENYGIEANVEQQELKQEYYQEQQEVVEQ